MTKLLEHIVVSADVETARAERLQLVALCGATFVPRLDTSEPLDSCTPCCHALLAMRDRWLESTTTECAISRHAPVLDATTVGATTRTIYCHCGDYRYTAEKRPSA